MGLRVTVTADNEEIEEQSQLLIDDDSPYPTGESKPTLASRTDQEGLNGYPSDSLFYTCQGSCPTSAARASISIGSRRYFPRVFVQRSCRVW